MKIRKASDMCADAAALVGKVPSFHALFRVLFPESERVMVEYSTGLRKTSLTYRRMGKMVLGAVPSVVQRLASVEKGSEVGLCMHGGVKWTAAFWALLMSGYRPVLICPEEIPSDGVDPAAAMGLAAVITDEDGITFGDGPQTVPPEVEWADGFFFRTPGGVSCRYDMEAARSAVIRAMDMPVGKTEEVKALIAAPLSSELGLFSLLALQAMGAVAVFPQEGRVRSISDPARSHDATHIVSYPLALSAMAGRMRRRKDGAFRSGALDKALASGGLFGNLRYGSLFRNVRTEMTGPSVEVIYTIDDDLNPDVLAFFSRAGYITGCFSDGNGYKPEPVENAVDMLQVRAAALVRPMVGRPVLVVSLESGLSSRKVASVMESVRTTASDAGADGVDIVFTTDDLSYGSCRVDRIRIAADLAAGRISRLEQESVPARRTLTEDDVRCGVTRCFAETLDRPVEEITYTGDFFTTFGGESLDYFVLLNNLETMFDVELSSDDGSRLSSVKALTRYILDHQED